MRAEASDYFGLHMGEQTHPHRRHARGSCVTFSCLEQFIDRSCRPIAPHPGKRSWQPVSAAAIGDAPSIHMKHRHHRQHAIARRHIQRIRQSRAGIGMQNGRAMAVEHAFGIAGGASWCSKGRRCGVFIEAAASRTHQWIRFRSNPRRQSKLTLLGVGMCSFVGHRTAPAFDAAGIAVRLDALRPCGKKVKSKNRKLVFGMIDDVVQSVRETNAG